MNGIDAYPTWQIALLALVDAAVIAWLYRQVKKQEPMEMANFDEPPFKLTPRNAVRYDKSDLREPNDSPFLDSSEWDEPRPAA